jgi:hypothetical protein
VTLWLTYLATHLGGPGRPDFAWWQLEFAVPGFVCDVIGGLLGGLVVSLVVGPVAGALFVAVVVLVGVRARAGAPWTLEAWLYGRLDAWLGRLVTRPIMGPIAAAMIGTGERVPIERRFALTVGRFIALLTGVVRGLMVYPGGGPFRAAADGVAAALAVGLAVGFFTISPRTVPSEVNFGARRATSVFFSGTWQWGWLPASALASRSAFSLDRRSVSQWVSLLVWPPA